MKLEKYLETYYWFSGKASDVARQLAFAGVAIIWIFKAGNGLQTKIPNGLLLPLILLCLSLASDLLQYVTGTIIWGFFHRYHEKKMTGDIKASAWLMKPILIFFILKIILVSAAFIIMICFFWSMFSINP